MIKTLTILLGFVGFSILAHAQVRDFTLSDDGYEQLMNGCASMEKLLISDDFDKAVFWKESGLESLLASSQFDMLASYMVPGSVNGFIGNEKSYASCRDFAVKYAIGVEFDLVKLVSEKGIDGAIFRKNMTDFFQSYLFKGLVAKNDLAALERYDSGSISNEDLLELYRGCYSKVQEEMMYFAINNGGRSLFELFK